MRAGAWLEIGVWSLTWAAFGSAFLWWSALSHHWRQALALASSLCGLALLVVALNMEGQREAPTTAFVLATPYVTRVTSASASSAYYVLTGVFLLLGTAGLALSHARAERLARSVGLPALALATGVAVLRFVLEQAAAPAFLVRFFGVTWLGPAVGAYLALRLKALGQGFWATLGALASFALLSRVPVLLMYALASWLRLGSHYDITPLERVRQPFTGRAVEFSAGSFDQLAALALTPQLVFWMPVTWVLAAAGAALAVLLFGARRPHATPAPAEPARDLASQP